MIEEITKQNTGVLNELKIICHRENKCIWINETGQTMWTEYTTEILFQKGMLLR